MTQVRTGDVTRDVNVLAADVLDQLGAGARFAGLFATAPAHLPSSDGVHQPDEPLTLTVVTAGSAGLDLHQTQVTGSYPCLTTDVPAAFWYERVVHDLFGVVPQGHPRLDPLVLPLPHPEPGTSGRPDVLPRPGSLTAPARLVPDERAVPRHVHGPGLFTIPHGPVRSGVMESVEYLVETPGEDIPHLQLRIFAKHRGAERAFQGRTADTAVLLAERVEGVSSVAHALAYSHALESAADVEVPEAAALVRVLHAELERIANHLDSAVKLADAAGLAVAVARLSWHKESILRVRDRLCGNRFGRGVVIPGGVHPPRQPLGDPDLRAELVRLERAVRSDAGALMSTSSFLDRIRGTGPLSAASARTHGALGPVGRASGYFDDGRVVRPYDAYPGLEMLPASGDVAGDVAGDAQARARVRWHEVRESFHLIQQVLARIPKQLDQAHLAAPMPTITGRGVGWAEAAQGEVVYVVDLVEDLVVRCWPRAASFHNLSLFHEVFAGDILTDFPFIEASFGLSIAGAVL
jgi:Ni,Fe-hydrogenase III large subunit